MLTEFQSAKLLQELRKSNASVEDLARAWASLDGKSERFDASKNVPVMEDTDGTYYGYMIEVEEIIKRAMGYANDRRTKND